MSKTLELYNSPSAMEPLFPDDPSCELEGLAIKLLQLSAGLSSSVHKLTREAIADFLRPMNTYYSNLIEGHDTHPIDIYKAINGDYSDDKDKRNYQEEARAHIEVHKNLYNKINAEGLKMELYSEDFIKHIHEEFYKHLSESFRTVTSEEGSSKIVNPGQFRTDEVKVGSHIAPAYKHLDVFLERFNAFYASTSNQNKNKIKRIISIAAAHHRLAWIHPFLDGNGRVTRLFSDALLMQEGLDASGLWSISRGLARKKELYRIHLANADLKRRGDYDGRGNLSNKMLFEFCKFFLELAIDQVEYMNSILATDTILSRLEAFSELLFIKKGIRKESKYVLIDLFVKGSISKLDVMRITNTSDKTAKIITDDLEALGLVRAIRAKGKKVSYLPAYPINFSASIFPGLYPSSKEMDLIDFY